MSKRKKKKKRHMLNLSSLHFAFYTCKLFLMYGINMFVFVFCHLKILLLNLSFCIMHLSSDVSIYCVNTTSMVQWMININLMNLKCIQTVCTIIITNAGDIHTQVISGGRLHNSYIHEKILNVQELHLELNQEYSRYFIIITNIELSF